MSKSYYEVSRDEVIKRLESIKNGDYVEFFRASDEFALAITLAYFSLAEELLIDRDSKNSDIAKRFKKHIDDASLNGLLTNDITIRSKEDKGNSVEWFLSTLRNGMIHNGFEVDYDNRVIDVHNEGALNKLDCSVTFDWFLNFTLGDYLLKRTFDTYKYTVVFNPFIKPENASYIRNYDDIRSFIENDLPAFDIEISFNDSNGDQTKIRRDVFIAFCHERESLFWSLLNSPDSLSEEENARFEKFRKNVESKLEAERDTITLEEYDNKFYSELFEEWFVSEFKEKFGNYDISISKFDRTSPKLNLVINGLNDDGLEKQLFPTARKRREFFNQHPVFQRIDIARAVSRVVNYDKVDYMLSLQYLLNMYMMHKDAVRDEYGLSKFMRRILKSNRVPDSQQIQREYMQAIHDGMLDEGVVHTYDKQITEHILGVMNYYDDDICLRCREICGDQAGEFSEEQIEKIGGVLKREYPERYTKITEELIKNGLPSDQVLSVYNENDLYRLCNAKYVIRDQLDAIVIGLLYTLGINTYVVNKETVFAGLTDTDYSFMDGLNIQGFSKDAYKICSDKKSKRRSNNSSIKKIDRTIPGINCGLSAATDDEEKTKKRNQIAAMLADRQEKVNENNDLNAYLDGRVDDEFGGVKMTSLANKECATTIRNCFAHSGRIFVDGREPGGEIRLVLTDYDENGNLSGVVKADLSSLISFFSNKVFKDEMDKKDGIKEDTGEKSK